MIKNFENKIHLVLILWKLLMSQKIYNEIFIFYDIGKQGAEFYRKSTKENGLTGKTEKGIPCIYTYNGYL